MPSVYEFDDYKALVSSWLASNGENRGGVARIARFLNIHSSFVSQVLKGTKDFSQEQAFKLAKFMDLNENGRDYFVYLLLESRAGTQDLKKYYSEKRLQIRAKARQVTENIGSPYEMSENEKAQFYSDPIFSQIRLLTSLERFHSAEDIARGLGLPLSLVEEVLKFLLDKGLCRKDEKGCLQRGTSRTHLDSSSPLVKAHHRNWRSKVLEMYYQMDESDLVFTAPLTISKKDFDMIREELLLMIGRITEVVDESKEEDFVVFNLDWIRWRQISEG